MSSINRYSVFQGRRRGKLDLKIQFVIKLIRCVSARLEHGLGYVGQIDNKLSDFINILNDLVSKKFRMRVMIHIHCFDGLELSPYR